MIKVKITAAYVVNCNSNVKITLLFDCCVADMHSFVSVG